MKRNMWGKKTTNMFENRVNMWHKHRSHTGPVVTNLYHPTMKMQLLIFLDS